MYYDLSESYLKSERHARRWLNTAYYMRSEVYLPEDALNARYRYGIATDNRFASRLNYKLPAEMDREMLWAALVTPVAADAAMFHQYREQGQDFLRRQAFKVLQSQDRNALQTAILVLENAGYAPRNAAEDYPHGSTLHLAPRLSGRSGADLRTVDLGDLKRQIANLSDE